jgi:medium-chain acyl-[acyl-carrier-protein] hydrolase
MGLHKRQYAITSYLTNSQGQLGLYHLLNLLQDAAMCHAQSIGIGKKEMEKMGLFWVLTRQHLSMKQWPSCHQEIEIQTWIRGENGVVSAHRDFRILLEGEVIGEATSSWLTLSQLNRRPMVWDRDQVIGFLYDDRVSLDNRKIPLQTQTETLAHFGVRNSDIDQNLHVNNTKYAQWILDAIPFDDHYRFQLVNYEVNFLAETKLNDLIRIERKTLSEDLTFFQGIRTSDEKIVFSSHLGYRKKSLPHV